MTVSRVLDYNTGALRDRKEITSENPTPLGRNLQPEALEALSVDDGSGQ